MNSLSQQIKLLTDTLGNQISESLVVDPIITQEEPSFIENFIENNQTLANIYKVVRDKDGFNAITTNFSGKIQQILNSNEIITPNLARFASIYLQALIKCMDCVKISSTQELFDNSTLEIYISLIEKALNHDNPEILRSSYTKFAQTIGSKNTKIFSIFNEQIKAMLAKKPPNNVVRLQLVSFTRFISCYAALSLAIPLLLELFNDFKLYMAEYCHVVSTIIMQAYRISPEDFQERQINLQQASQIYELIKKDKSVPDHVKWEALVSLVFLLHDFIKTGQFDPISAQISAEITKKVMKFDIQHFNALQAALYSALIVAEMNGNPTYVAIFKNFASPIAEKFHTMQASLFENYHKLRYFLCVDFPVALYFTNYLQFVDIFPYFTTEYTIIPRPLTCRIIDKCMSSKMNGEQRTLMFSAVVNMLESLSSTTDILESFPLIFHTFEINPDILYKILTGNHGLCTFLWRPCPTNGIRSLCNSFISAISIPIFTLTDWMVIDCTISSILNCSDFFMALKPEIIADLGRVFKFIINTIREYFANEDKRKYIQVQQMMVTVMQLEVLSLNFMPTPLSAVCIEMLETVVEIIEANKSEVIVSIPSDVYKEFIAEFKKTGKFDINSDRNFLPLLKIPTENTVIAYAYIKHIGNMASALDPQVFKDEERKFSNALSPAVLREEFSITVLLFETLVLKTPPQTFLGILNCCLSSPSYIGTTGASLFARLARPEFITPIFQSVLMKMQEIGWNFTDVNTQYCANAMRMTQLLIAKEEWIVDKVEIFLIVQLTMIFASYMNMLVSAQRLYQCSEFIIVSVNRGGSNFKAKNRLELAFILASWLSRIECGPSTEKAGASICNAIAKVVEDVPFSLDNYNDLLFLTTCLNKRLEKQPSLHASIGNAIASLFKSNFWLFSRSELAKTLIGTELSRANYLFAAKEALVNSTLLPPKKEENLIDFLFNNNFKVLAEIVSIVPQKLAEGFGNDLVMAAVSRHVELEFISMMIELELLNTTDKTKNTILRGNGVPSRSIMAFAKIFGSEWLKTIYNPMSEIAKDVVSKGKSLNIKTGRLSPNESMEENRKTFREVFIKAIDVITAAIPKLPTQIIKMVQIVYEKVTEKFGSHGTMIVNGIIFLRLIIPNLTAPAPDELNVSEEARQCLVSVCIALMAASLRGDLSDKGEDYIMFNDVAALALDRFTAAVNDIIKTDISGAAFKWIETDENSLCLSLASVISSTPRDLEIFMRDHKEENCDERKMFDFCMKQVAKTKKYRPMRETDNIFSSLPRDIKEYVTSIPSEEETELLKECVFIDTPDDSPYDVVYFVSSRIPQNISDKTLYSYLFHVLASIPGNYHLIIDVPTLDVEKYLPKGPMIKKFIPILDIAMKNAVSIKVIRSNYEFAEYFHQFRSLSHYSDLFIFVTSKIDLRPLQGLSDKMPVECHHAYDDNGAPQVTIINQREATIRVTRFCLHTLYKVANISVVNCYMLSNIHTISEITAPNENLEFTIYLDNCLLVFTTYPASGLYYLIKSAFERVSTKIVKYPQICTDSGDTAATCWLLLFIALVNLGEENGDSYLMETSLQLLTAINTVYGLEMDLPENVDDVKSHMIDLLIDACFKRPQEYGHIIIEYEKVFNVVKNKMAAVKLLRGLAPFLSTVGGYIGRRFLIELSVDDEECMLFIKKQIWQEMLSMHPYAIDIFDIFLPMFTTQRKQLLFYIASENEKEVSKKIVSSLLIRLQSAPYAALSLIESRMFDVAGYGASLLRACLTICGHTAQDDAIAKLVSMLSKFLSKDAGNLEEFMLRHDKELVAGEIKKLFGNTIIFNQFLDEIKTDENEEIKEYAKLFV